MNSYKISSIALFDSSISQHLQLRSWTDTMVFHTRSKAADTVNVDTAALEAQPGSSRQSLEQRAEKEVQEHPDEITGDAQAGVQKAEATALVWSRKALYSTYAW